MALPGHVAFSVGTAMPSVFRHRDIPSRELFRPVFDYCKPFVRLASPAAMGTEPIRPRLCAPFRRTNASQLA
jgi:hypothetical protein